MVVVGASVVVGINKENGLCRWFTCGAESEKKEGRRACRHVRYGSHDGNYLWLAPISSAVVSKIAKLDPLLSERGRDPTLYVFVQLP